MGEIKINVSNYTSENKKLENVAERSSDNNSKIKFSPTNYKLDSIDKYVEAATKLRTLLRKYNELLYKDISGLQKIKEEFLKVDETIKNRLKR